jgi:hypothetical protein
MISYRDITSAISLRTVIVSIVPYTIPVDACRVIEFDENINSHLKCALVGIFNSLCFDYLARQKTSANHLAIYIFKQIPVLTPENFNINDFSFIVPRVLELTYTAWDIKAFADDVWRDADDAMRALLRHQWEANKAATGGHESKDQQSLTALPPFSSPSSQFASREMMAKWKPPEWAEIAEDGIPLPPFKWDEERRAVLRAELDALYARLYGLSRDELRYILDPSDVYGPEFPGETFRVLKEKEIKKYGEYRTRRLVLEAWDGMEKS